MIDSLLTHSRKGSGIANSASNELTNELRVYEERGRKLATPEIRAPYEVRVLGAQALATKEGTAANVDGPG